MLKNFVPESCASFWHQKFDARFCCTRNLYNKHSWQWIW